MHISRRAASLGAGYRIKSPLKTVAAAPINPLMGTAGESVMKLLDSGIRVFTLAQGTGVRWLKEELGSRNVKVPLTDGCLEELVREADSGAWLAVAASTGDVSYLTLLRQQLELQATFVQRWTGSDEKFAANDGIEQAFVKIARNYALPRPWKLSEPVAVDSQHLRPSNWKWATAIEARSVA